MNVKLTEVETRSASVSREIVSLTSLRGYFAAWVVISHFWEELLILLPNISFLSSWAEHGHSAVPGFFVLSGWVLAHNYREAFRKGEVSWIRFLGLRLARIYPVHLATLAAVGVLVAGATLSGHSVGGAYSFKALIAQLLLMQAWIPGVIMSWNYPAWSISSEWFAYLLFPLATRFDFLFGSFHRALATTVFATIGTVMVIIAWKPLPVYELALVVPCFLAGMGVQGLLSKEPRFGPQAPVAATVLLGTMVASCFISNYTLREFLMASIPTAIVYLLAGRGIAKVGVVWESRPVRVLGETSYSLYMVHSVVEKVLSQLFPPQEFASSGLGLRLLLTTLWVLATIFATWGCYTLVERPARKFMRRLLG